MSKLSKKEMIAAMAMQGMLAHNSNLKPEILCERAVNIADTLLEALGESEYEDDSEEEVDDTGLLLEW